MIPETDRAAAFKACPILESYIGTMLEDAQFHEDDLACEEDRDAVDVGTIYDLNDAAFLRCQHDCEEFFAANREDIESALALEPGSDDLRYARNGRGFDYDRIGHYFYMLRVGHGVSFTDDSEPGGAECLRRLNDATRARRGFDVTVDEDGEVYIY